MEQHAGLRPPAAKARKGKGCAALALTGLLPPVSFHRCAPLLDRAAEVAAVLTNEPHRVPTATGGTTPDPAQRGHR